VDRTAPPWAGLGKNCYCWGMQTRIDLLASGPGWRVHDVLCSAGPRDRPFEEQHQAVCIAAVLRGSFRYRTSQGAGAMAPGSILLGNPGGCFECGHEHAPGDRCLSFLFEPACFETILSAVPGARSNAFAAARLPPLEALTPVIVAAELAGRDPVGLEEAGLELAVKVVSLLADGEVQGISGRDEKRIAGVLRRIEAHADEPLSLMELAREAGMSRYHFLRTFRHVVGLTPHQFILRTRLHHAAIALRRSQQTVLDIALDAGFADLSTFNRRFRATMGVTPSAYRGSR
jgi:AraC family transcriptional regulator